MMVTQFREMDVQLGVKLNLGGHARIKEAVLEVHVASVEMASVKVQKNVMIATLLIMMDATAIV